MGMLTLWYTDGWKQRAQMIMARLDRTMDFFSIGLLVRTMFALFRQDGAGSVDGPLSVKINAFFGRLISRILGAIIRSSVLIVGLVTITAQALLGVAVLAIWAAMPALPIIGTIIMATGWIPWQF